MHKMCRLKTVKGEERRGGGGGESSSPFLFFFFLLFLFFLFFLFFFFFKKYGVSFFLFEEKIEFFSKCFFEPESCRINQMQALVCLSIKSTESQIARPSSKKN